MKFLVDAQLPPQLARWISDYGHGATHVFDGGLQRATDEVVWQHALKEDAVIISKDEDFVDRWLLSDNPPAVIWVRKGNCSNRALMAWMEPLWPDVLRRLEQGERLIELRGQYAPARRVDRMIVLTSQDRRAFALETARSAART